MVVRSFIVFWTLVVLSFVICPLLGVQIIPCFRDFQKILTMAKCFVLSDGAFCMFQVLFAFKFESEWPNDNSETKQLPFYKSRLKSQMPFGCLTDFIQI